MKSVPDLPLWLGVLKHSAPLVRGEGGGPSSCPKKNYDGFLLMWCNFKILTIPTFPEHVGLSGLPPSGHKLGAS